MRHHHIVLLTLTACGGQPFTVADPLLLDEAGHPINSERAASSGTTDLSAAASGAMAASGSVVIDPPTLEAGSLTMEAGSPMAMSGATSGMSESMSGASGGSGSVSAGNAPPLTCTGATTQACGPCATDTQTRVCTNGVWSTWSNCTVAQAATLQGVGAGDFTISFDLTDTNTTVSQAVVNQWSICTQPATSPYWDLTLNSYVCGYGSIETEHFTPTLGLSTHCTNLPTTSHVVLHRSKGIITLTTNTTTDTWNDPTLWDAVSPLAMGTEACAPVGGPVPLSGSLTNLCVEKQ